MIPISVVDLGTDVEERVLSVIRSGNLAQGPVVAEFEGAFADLVGVRHAIAVNNGTTALVAAMQAIGLGHGDEVITSPFTFIATVNAILETGATVRFADVHREDFGIDAESVRAQLTDRTRAIVPVHLYGQAVDLDPLVAITMERRLTLVEDAAQAHGARYAGRGVGSFGIGCFSFYATKNLTTGEGGMITTDDDGLAERLRILRNQGMRERYHYVVAGHNYRLTDLQAALVLPQIARYREHLSFRRRNAAALSGLLVDVPGLTLPRELPGREHVWHQYTVLLPDDVDRDRVVASLSASGVGAGVYYPRLAGDYPAYRSLDQVVPASTPVAADIASRCLSLPVHPKLSDADVNEIARALRTALEA